MRRMVLLLNALAVFIGAGLGIYIIYTQDPSIQTPYVIAGFITCLTLVIWGFLAYLLYGIRFTLARREHSLTLFIRSERQAALLAVLIGLHLSLQGFLLWNVFSATILTLVILIIEYYFLSQESQIIDE